MMDFAMTTIAQGDQVFGNVVALGASPADVVDFEKIRTSALLTSPAIALQHFSLEISIGIRIQPNPPSFWPSKIHSALCTWWVNSIFWGSGSSENSRVSARSSDSGLPASRLAPAKKSAQIISRQ
jgi:hypothetical protein